jgi:Tryptophan-rich sensory protein (mitochondrial benzodiazepine receptor homolog)
MAIKKDGINIFRVCGKINLPALIISITVSEGTGFLSVYFTRDSRLIYKLLEKPWFAPPSYVFAPVWIVLYLLMGIASYRVWMRGKECQNEDKPITIYIIQLMLNYLWPILFFNLAMAGLAFLELIVLLIFVIWAAAEFFRIDRISGCLMVPYILWTAFAGVLNFYIWILNV